MSLKDAVAPLNLDFDLWLLRTLSAEDHFGRYLSGANDIGPEVRKTRTMIRVIDRLCEPSEPPLESPLVRTEFYGSHGHRSVCPQAYCHCESGFPVVLCLGASAGRDVPKR